MGSGSPRRYLMHQMGVCHVCHNRRMLYAIYPEEVDDGRMSVPILYCPECEPEALVKAQEQHDRRIANLVAQRLLGPQNFPDPYSNFGYRRFPNPYLNW